MDDMISRLAVIQIIEKMRARIGHNLERAVGGAMIEILDEVGEDVGKLPSALGTNLAKVGTDCISRRAALDALRKMQTYKLFSGDDMLLIDQAGAQTELMMLPPAQPDKYWKEQCQSYEQTINKLRESLSMQHEIIRCKDCKYWNSGSCECREHAVNCQDYYVGDIEIEAEHFCGYAERRE